MPADLLLPLFAVTLAANALLVALALRALWRGQNGEVRRADEPIETRFERGAARQPPAKAAPAPEPDPAVDIEVDPAPAIDTPETDPAPGIDAVDAPKPPAARIDEPAAAQGPAEAPPDPPAPPAIEPTPSPPRRRPAKAAAQPSSSAVSRPAPRGGRRRFALPPLDEDHEKVSRSIQTFLSGTDGQAGESPGPDAGRVVTVAVLGIDPEASPAQGRTTAARGGVSPATAELRALLERTVRSTARGTDRVGFDRHGRVRVILAGTGELAAYAYLRRIRTIVEPIAEAATPPARIVVATATDLDGAIESARRRAERRFAAALEAGTRTAADGADQAAGTDADEPIAKPRAAGD